MTREDGIMIDWTRIEELRSEFGSEDFDEVAEVFLAEVDGDIAALRDPAGSGARAAQLHALKGSALNLGFAVFADHCRVAEQAAARGAPEEIDVDGIISCYEASKEELQAAIARFSRA